MGDGRIFLKTRRDVSFYKFYRMSLISAGSILLDSTFKGFSQDEGLADFSKNLCASLFNKFHPDPSRWINKEIKKMKNVESGGGEGRKRGGGGGGSP